MLNKKGYIYLPFYILLASLVLKLVSGTFSVSDYLFDEVIVTTISRQNIVRLLDTVLAEPHPPGFYILVKLLPIGNIFLTRLFVSITSYGILFLALLYGNKSKVISRYKLSLGLSLFFSSFAFFSITSDVKQNSISLPILIFNFFVFLNLLKSRSSFNTKDLLLSNFLVFTLLFFGYNSYILGLLGLVIVAVYLRKYRLPVKLLAIQILLFIIYFAVFAVGQIGYTIDRFRWIGEYDNSFFNALNNHLLGISPYHFVTDIVVFIFLFLVAFSFFDTVKKLKAKEVYLFVFPIPILIFVAFLTKAFVRARYTSFLFFLLSILAGWGLLQLGRYRKQIVPLILVTFLLVVSVYYQAVRLNNRRFNLSLASYIESYSEDIQFGLISEHPIFAFIYELQYKDYTNVIPVNVFFPNIFVDSKTIEKKHLMLEGIFYDLSERQLRNLLGKNKLSNYFYLFTNRGKVSYFDPGRKVLKVLSSACSEQKVETVNPNNILLVFKNCSFE